jgi:hypothetical protein
LSDNGQGYYIFGGSWVELALASRGVEYSRPHVDIDVAVEGVSSVETLKRAGCELEKRENPGEVAFFAGKDRHGTPLEVMVREWRDDDCERIDVGGQAVVGLRLEIEYLEKNLHIARGRRNHKVVRPVYIQDVAKLEEVVDKEVVEKYLRRYSSDDRDRTEDGLRKRWEEEGLEGVRKTVLESDNLPEDLRVRASEILDHLEAGLSYEEVEEAFQEIVDEYAVVLVKERYGLVE